MTFLNRKNRDAFTLLEIILAIAILGITIAIIGQGFRFGLERVKTSQNELRATLVAESILAQIAAGVLPPDAVTEAAYEDDKNWIYSVASESVGEDGLLSVKVSVRNTNDTAGKFGSVALTRWITNPDLTLAEEESQSMGGIAAESTTGTTGSSSTTGSSTTGSKTSTTSGTTTGR